MFPTYQSGDIKILDYIDANNVEIVFLKTNNTKRVRMGNVLTGKIVDKEIHFQMTSVCGVGEIGCGEYAPNIHKKIYKAWSSMIRRCYSKKVHELQPSYVNCTVCEQWLNFQNFAKWYESQVHSDNCQVDKDLLSYGNKVYSPETCCLLPEKLNKLIIKQKVGKNGLPTGVFLIERNVGSDRPCYGAQCGGYGKSRGYIGRYHTIEEAEFAYRIVKSKLIQEYAQKYIEDLEPRAFQALINMSVKLKENA